MSMNTVEHSVIYTLQLGLCIGQNDRYSIYHMISKVSIENE